MQDFFGSGSSEHAKTVYENIPVECFAHCFTLGPYNTHGLMNDPKRIGFLFARYKFAAKMLQGRACVLEIGCQEGLGALVVAQAVEHLVAIDFYKPHIESCLKCFEEFSTNIEFRGYDILDGPIQESFDGALSMDVLEHIDPVQEDRFMTNIAESLSEYGILVLGMPSLESQQYVSPASKAGHINCKSGEALREFCKHYFHNVFMFGMNDELVHTGFLPMAHYLIALCVHPRRSAG